MIKRVISVLLFILIFTQYGFSQKLSSQFFRKADRFFNKYVVKGEVDYQRILKEPKRLNSLTKIISTTSLQKARPRFKKAFYINAYNILLIKNVIDDYPVQFPLEELGMFSNKKNLVAGDTLTLNEIESKKLMREFKDPRILFALSTASQGSIPLGDFAFKPRKLKKQLRKRIKETTNDYEFVRVMNRSSKVLLAESFKKYDRYFMKEEIIYLINQYREEPLPKGYAIDFYPTNRKLNIKN